ncbi:CDP-glycerol glycerophosphotransferase family protein [Vagococcus zengguangii]|uniref:Glycosyltransferase n=1 Tax=Vagococcus zengguangii TaxID=2571750 RepID=A0A4D7CS29_9ENTE|nr:glycosyltransferase [Vagococcus zengguangii]QCI87035.1 glycosyltransferase [Vagococcus zengguangii]
MGQQKIKEIINFGGTQTKKWRDNRFRELASYYTALHQSEIQEDSVLFESYHAVTTTGNVYAIYQQLVKTHPNLKKYWVYIEESPLTAQMKKDKQTQLVKYESKQYFKLLATAKYLINDTSFMPYFVKRAEQIYVNTWHGTPLKTLGKDILSASITDHKNIQRNLLATDYLMMPNRFTADKLLTSHDCDGIFPGRVFITGNARVDRNFLPREEVINNYQLPSDKAILLYAPTWKKSLEDTSEADIASLVNQVEQLQVALGDKTQVLLKSHYFIYQSFVTLGLADKVVPDWVDTNELLGAVDGLITDYSSIFFDYLPNNRPIYFYMPDLESYQNTRGLYLEVEGLPGQVYRTFNELVKGVQIPEADYMLQTANSRQQYLGNFCSKDNGEAAQRVVDIVFNNQITAEEISYKNEKQVIVLYAGGLFNNGITNSLINLTNEIDYDKYELIIFEFDNIANHQEKSQNYQRLNKNAKVIYKFGRIPQSYQDSLAVDLFLRRGLGAKNVDIAKVERYYQTDFRRIFGNLMPDVIIDFGGYNKVMTSLIAFSKVERKFAFFHNLMLEEYNKVINNRYKHRWNLKVIFSLYHYFDKIISVTESAKESNRQTLAKFAPKVKSGQMAALENLIDWRGILTGIEKGEQLNNDYSLSRLIISEKSERQTSQLTLIPTLDEQATHFIAAARFSPEKNHLEMLAAFKEVVKKHPQVRLHLLGEGPLEQAINHTILELGLQDHVFSYGHIANPHYLMSQCDCAVLFSKYEGQGMFLLEAKVAGLPIVGTDVPGIQSVIESGVNGLLVPCNHEGMVAGFESYLTEQVPVPQFDYQTYNQQLLEQFEQLLKG